MKKNEENLEKHIEKFSSGKMKKEWTTLNGELHGELKTYLSTGEIIKKVIFNQGVLEKICDYRSDIEYDREFFINHLENGAKAVKGDLRAVSGSYYTEIIDIPILQKEIKFIGKLLFKVWGKSCDLWLVFLSLEDNRLLRIPVYKNREKLTAYTGKNSEYDFSVNYNWLEIFEIETLKSSSKKIYISTAKVYQEGK